MLDHFGFIVRDLAASRRFYEAALKPLGLVVIQEQPSAFLMGRGASEPLPFLFIGQGRPSFWTDASMPGASPFHFRLQGAGSRCGRCVPCRGHCCGRER